MRYMVFFVAIILLSGCQTSRALVQDTRSILIKDGSTLGKKAGSFRD